MTTAPVEISATRNLPELASTTTIHRDNDHDGNGDYLWTLATDEFGNPARRWLCWIMERMDGWLIGIHQNYAVQPGSLTDAELHATGRQDGSFHAGPWSTSAEAINAVAQAVTGTHRPAYRGSPTSEYATDRVDPA